jgi:hypothetical protein
MTDLSRRRFLQVVFAGAAAFSGLSGCTPDEHTDADAAQLAARMRDEAARSGHGPFGPLHVRGYRGLADLPYFDLDGDGRLHTVVPDLPPVFDFHTHLGMQLLCAPDVDLARRAPRTQYYLDCDRTDPGCDLDLDVYINSAFTADMHDDLSWEMVRQLVLGGGAASTHTIPNLVAEMDAVGCRQAAVLPIAFGLPFGDDLTTAWLDALGAAGGSERLVPFASVHPSDAGWQTALEGYAARGVRGLKVHPEFQRVFPDESRMLDVYAACERLGLVVIFHAGRSGIEPAALRPYALLRRYERAFAAFPRVQFVLGHAGARDVTDAVRLARQYPNVWLEITGQGVTALDGLITEVGMERLLFGSDWPFYPLAATLAKVLLVTERRPAARTAILRANADRAFALAAATRRVERPAGSG